MSALTDRAAATVRGTRRKLLGSLAGAVALGASREPVPAAAKSRCPACRKCKKRCCPTGSRCFGKTCVAACSSSTCDALRAVCPLLPADNVWNARVDGLPVDPQSDAYVAAIGATAGLHPDFGAGILDGGPVGIPFVIAPVGTAPVAVTFEFDDESDPGPYPVPADAPVEGGFCADGDRHVLVVDPPTCTLYELFDAKPGKDGSWQAGSGAVYDLRSNALRPDGWTSADAAGLPILPGLVRREEAVAGSIAHALRFTAPRTRRAHVWPARHDAGAGDDPGLPPLGQRFRLKAGFDLSGFSPTNVAILTALKQYGMLLADNGSAWFLSGTPDDLWDNDDLHELQSRVTGADFEAVDCSSLTVDPDSGQAQ